MKKTLLKLTMCLTVFLTIASTASAGINLPHEINLDKNSKKSAAGPFQDISVEPWGLYDYTVPTAHSKLLCLIYYITARQGILEDLSAATISTAQVLPNQTNGVGEILARTFLDFYRPGSTKVSPGELKDAFLAFTDKFMLSVNPLVEQQFPAEIAQAKDQLNRSARVLVAIIVKLKQLHDGGLVEPNFTLDGLPNFNAQSSDSIVQDLTELASVATTQLISSTILAVGLGCLAML